MWLFERPIAHRGLHNDVHTENSMSSFANAIEHGYNIETDVHLLKSGEVVVFHDNTLKRVCGKDVKIEELTAADIKGDNYLLPNGEHIPLFSEMLELVDGKVGILLELKFAGFSGKLEKAVADLIKGKESWIAVVGIYQGHPYEIFTGKAESFLLPNWVEKGWVIRVKEDNKARYDFQFLDKDGYKVTIEGLSRLFNKEFWNYAKLISGILRHGMPLPNVVDLVSKLNFDIDSITTWKNGVARALKRYITDGTETGEVCPECGGKIIYTGGCKECSNKCGWSKCS